jgi:hypothetical protein
VELVVVVRRASSTPMVAASSYANKTNCIMLTQSNVNAEKVSEELMGSVRSAPETHS